MANAHRILNNRGVALLLVLGAISMLTIAIVEFVTDTDIQMELAMNERDRLRAEYLAYSGANLMQLELQLEKSAKGLLANAPASMTQGISSGPLCKQFPMSSALLRGVFLGDSEPAGEASEEKAASGAAAKEEAGKQQAEKGPMINAFQKQAASEFLSFVGDFDGQCEDLQSRINLNSFFDLDPAQQVIAGSNPYDQLKLTIMSLLEQPAYKEIFGETAPEEIKNKVRNIADWVDKNDQINELGGVVGGPEASLYGSEPGPQHRVKNGKMLSQDEVFLVKGVTDDWFGVFRDKFTVYGDNKVNVCMADSAVTMALITRYAASNQKFATVDLTKPEMKDKLTKAIAMDCKVAQPQASKIAQDVDTILGGGAAGSQPSGTETPPTSTTTGQTTPTAVASNFSQMITTESRWYELKSTGQVGDVVVHLTQVWDTKDANPKQWKMVFSKFE
jgi:type II secretory pathway component PulK